MQFRLLGPLEAVEDGRSVPLGGGKQRALLAALLLQANRVVTTDMLVDDLWGEAVPESSRKMVQIHVSQLRKLLPDGVLRTRAPGYVVELGAHEIDLHRFEALHRDGRAALAAGRPDEASSLLTGALGLWRGPALAELTEPFAQAERARLEEMRLTALEDRVDADLALGRHDGLVGELEALVAHEPLRARARGQLMQALARAGREAEALETYQAFRRMLADDLGIDPPAALRELERRILRQEAAPAPTAPAERRPRPAGPEAPVIVGRAGPLESLEHALDDVLGGRRRVVFVTGEAGIGKTTLLRAFVDATAARTSLLCGLGQCLDNRGPGEPYHPVLDALGRIGTRAPAELLDVLTRCAPTWLPQLPSLAGPDLLERIGDRLVGTTRERMLREMVEALDALSAERPVVLVLEDVQWADVSTLELVETVAKRTEPAHLLVLASARPAAAAAEPSARALQRLTTRGLAVEVPLGPLDTAALAEYLGVRFESEAIASGLATVLRDLTRGNPLFAERVVEAWTADGSIGRADGGWELRARPEQLSEQVPQTLRELVRHALLELPASDRALLEAASAIGPSFASSLAAAAADQDPDAVETRCAALAAAGAFVASAGEEEWPDLTVSSRFAFTHDLWRELLYEGVPAGRRARLHCRIGDRLERAYASHAGELAAELAAHFVRGRDAVRALPHLRAAAGQALARLAPVEATAQLRTGLTLLPGVGDGAHRDAEELALLTLLAPALIATQGWASPEAEEALVRARVLATRAGTAEEQADVLHRLATVYEVRGRYVESEALLEESLALSAHEDGNAAVDRHEVLACSLFHQGRFGQALAHAEHGASAYDPAYPNPLTASYGDHSGVACHIWAGLALWFLGHPDEAARRAAEAVRLAESPPHDFALGTALAHAAIVAQLRREPEEALRLAERAAAAAEPRGFAYRLAMARVVRGWALTVLGSGAEGIRELRAGLELSRATGASMDDAYYLGLLADALVVEGDGEQALEVVAEALDVVRRGRSYFFEPELQRLRGEALVRLGRPGDAQAAFAHALDLARRQSARSLELRIALAIVALRDDADGSRDAVRELGRAFAQFTEGFADPDLVAARELLDRAGWTPSDQPPAAPAPPLPSGRPPVSAAGSIRYARSGDLHIAYQVTGGGPADIVLVPGFVSHLEKDWEDPRHARFLERLGSLGRLIRFDKRGTGLSDGPGDVPDLDARMDDVRAVMDAARSERALVFGYSEGGPLSILFSATHPERVSNLVLFAAFAKRRDPDDDYPWAPTAEERRRHADELVEDWGFEANMREMCPGADEAMARWWGERCRSAASPARVRALIEMNSRIDVRALLPAVRVPTLVIQRRDDRLVHVEEARYIAGRIPGAELVELDGADHFPAVGADEILDAVARFVSRVAGTGEQPADRVLATILVTDIAGSTGLVTRLGDRAWSELVARHDEVVRGEIRRLGGIEVDNAGDGFLALFDGPSRAVRCGERIRERLGALALDVRIGLHTGEVERRGESVRGIAVHLASRVAAAAEPNEVLVTATTRDIVAGSGLAFEDRGDHELPGIGEPRRLFALVAARAPS